MGVEKHGLKVGGAGYVGGFLQLFDWNGKSRKKLSYNKFDLTGMVNCAAHRYFFSLFLACLAPIVS